jgi:hypothetical protein
MRALIAMMGICALWGCEAPEPERLAVFGFFVDGEWRQCQDGTVVAVYANRTQFGCIDPEIAKAEAPAAPDVVEPEVTPQPEEEGDS